MDITVDYDQAQEFKMPLELFFIQSIQYGNILNNSNHLDTILISWNNDSKRLIFPYIQKFLAYNKKFNILEILDNSQITNDHDIGKFTLQHYDTNKYTLLWDKMFVQIYNLSIKPKIDESVLIYIYKYNIIDGLNLTLKINNEYYYKDGELPDVNISSINEKNITYFTNIFYSII